MQITLQRIFVMIAALPYVLVMALSGRHLLQAAMKQDFGGIAGPLCVALVATIVAVFAFAASRHEDMEKTKLGYAFAGITAVLVAVLIRSFS